MEDGQISFSQKYGYEGIPRPLKLEELPEEARTQIWNLIYVALKKTISAPEGFLACIGGAWHHVFVSVHDELDNLPLDEWDPDFTRFRVKLRKRIETDPFFKVFDLIEFVLRHPQCPPPFVRAMQGVFIRSRLAYTLDFGPPATIVPAVTSEEGAAIVESLQSLRQAGLIGSSTHLQQAAALINEGDWAGSVRESIHAVESVARQPESNSEQTLGAALKAIERQGALHPALKKAFESLYGYTSDEQGIRHALLNKMNARVGQDEAVFMLGACASFASYLWRKHVGGEPS